MQIPTDRQYTESHEWVQFSQDGTALVGLTDFAQDSLGSLVYVSLPETGESVAAGDAVGEVESVKAVSEINAPVSGTVMEVNTAVEDAPEAVNQDPYATWIVRMGDLGDRAPLMEAAAYAAHCAAQK